MAVEREGEEDEKNGGKEVRGGVNIYEIREEYYL